MSVVAVNRISSGLVMDDDGIRIYDQVWEVITNAKTDGPITVFAAGGLPQIGAGYTWTDGSDVNCIRTPKTSVKTRSEGTRRIWRLGLEFTNKQQTCQDQTPENPLDMPIKIRGGFLGRTKIATEDRHGDPLINAADEPIMPGLEVDDDQDTLVVEINTAYLSLSFRAGFKNRVNSNTQWGLSPRTIKMAGWDYELLYYGACYGYFKNVMTFKIDTDTWDQRVLNQGFREKGGVDGNGKPLYVTIVSEKDRGPLNVPTMLRADGTKLEAGGAPVWLQPEVLKETSFAALGLPDPLW
jgi:hypothetical protein